MASIRPRLNKGGETVGYNIRVFRGYDDTGKQLKPYTMEWEPPQGLTERQQQKLLNETVMTFEKDIKMGYAVDAGKQSFSQYAEYVLQLKESDGTKHRTTERYRELLARINPAIGSLKLTDIRPQHLNAFYQELAKPGQRKSSQKATATADLLKLMKKHTRVALARQSGLAAATITSIAQGKAVNSASAQCLADSLQQPMDKLFVVRQDNDKLSSKTIVEHHRLIRTILNQAEKEMAISYNPASRANPPKVEQNEANFFSDEEVVRIAKALETEPLKWRVVVQLLLLTGCRRGEVLGLKWDKVDPKANQLHICNNLLYSKKRGIYEDTTKTRASNRYVAIPRATIELLAEHKAHQKEKALQQGYLFSETDFLFTQEHTNKPMAPDSLTDYCNKLSQKYNLPHINPHAFRHTHISLLLLNGVDIVTTSKRAGHAKITTTVNTYAHVVRNADAAAANLFADVVLDKKKKG